MTCFIHCSDYERPISDTDLCHPNNCHQNEICQQSGKDLNCLSGLFIWEKGRLAFTLQSKSIEYIYTFVFDENRNILIVLDNKTLIYELNLQVNAMKILVIICQY